jgi:riboflavin-specific deaminase-like protein
VSLEIVGATSPGAASSPLEGIFRLGLLETLAPGQADVQRFGDGLRDGADAILVGPNTVLLDNPALDGATASGRRPVRVTLDPSAQIPPHYRFLDGSIRTLIGVSEATPRSYVRLLEERGIEPLYCGTARVDLKLFLERLAQRGLRNVLVEGGGRLNRALLDQGLVDRIHLMLFPLHAGGDGEGAPPPGRQAIGRLTRTHQDRRTGFVLLRYEPAPVAAP